MFTVFTDIYSGQKNSIFIFNSDNPMMWDQVKIARPYLATATRAQDGNWPSFADLCQLSTKEPNADFDWNLNNEI